MFADVLKYIFRLIAYKFMNRNRRNIVNNSLISNNPHYENYVKNNQNDMSQRIAQVKKTQEIRKIEKKSNQVHNSQELIDAIIKPIKVVKESKELILKKTSDIKTLYDKPKENPYVKQLWNTRTNDPYKKVLNLKNEEYKKKISHQTDLIVHKTTIADKEHLMREYEELKDVLELHNNELKIIYSTSKEDEHKEKFVYNNLYKYRIRHDAKDYNDLKEDHMKVYKEEQKKLEKDKQRMDEILELVLSNDDVTGDDKTELENIICKNISSKNIDALELEKEAEKLLKELDNPVKSNSRTNTKYEQEEQNEQDDTNAIVQSRVIHRTGKHVNYITKPLPKSTKDVSSGINKDTTSKNNKDTSHENNRSTPSDNSHKTTQKTKPLSKGVTITHASKVNANVNTSIKDKYKNRN